MPRKTPLTDPCSIPDCPYTSHRRGLCPSHYHKGLKDGSLEKILSHDAVQNFWNRVIKGDDDECWEWTGTFHKGGYGRLHFKNKRQLAPRVSYFLHNGKWPDNFACHTCDNPACVNPKHIYDGTPLDNMRDMVERGRMNPNPARAVPGSRILREMSKKKLDHLKTRIKKGHFWNVIATQCKVPICAVRLLARTLQKT